MDCDSYQYLSNGAHLKIDNLCDADFEDYNGRNCSVYLENDLCNDSPGFYLDNAVWSNHGYETGLNCPECGCGPNPTSLYDVPRSIRPSTPP